MAQKNIQVGLNAVNRTSGAFRKVRSEIGQTRRAVSGMSGMMMSSRRSIQQAGMQLSDFAVQVGGGQNAILAFTQNVPQFIQGFGAIGGIMAAVVTIAGTVAYSMYQTGTSISKITPLTGALKDEFEGLASAVGTAGTMLVDFANLTINHLDTVIVVASLVAGYFAGKLVASFLMARAAGWAFVGAATLTRIAMTALAVVTGTLTIAVRIMSVAVVVVSGVIRTMTMIVLGLTSATKVSAGVMGIVRLATLAWAVAVKVLNVSLLFTWRTVQMLMLAPLRALWLLLQGAALATSVFTGALIALRAAIIGTGIGALIVASVWLIDKFLDLVQGAGGFGEAMAVLGNVVLEVIDRMKLGFQGLLYAFKHVFYAIVAFGAEQLDKLDALVFKWVKSGAMLLARVAGWLDPDKDFEYFAAQINNVSRETFTAGDAAGKAADAFRLMRQYMDLAGAPIESWQDMLDLINKAKDGGVDIRDLFTGGGKDKGDEKDIIKSRFREIKDMVEDLASSISKTMGDSFLSMVDGTKSVGDAFRDMARDIIKKLYEVLVVEQMVAQIGTLLGGKQNSGEGLFETVLSKVFGQRAGGGPVSAGRPYVVGERGPEIFAPSTSGRIIPNGGGSAPVINMNYTFNGGLTAADLDRALPNVVEVTKKEVVGMFQRGGAMARVVR